MKCIFSLLLAIGCMFASMAQEKTARISIDSRVKYQHVTGFGGFSPSPQWQYWLGNSEMDKLFGKGEGQLGLNIVRLYMANSKNGWSAGVANAKRAKKYGAFIFASPWSPPASWKTNNSDSDGGELKEAYYEQWATFLNDYYKYMKQQGVEIDAVSIQNEPDWTASYQSCRWTGEQMAKFLRLYGNLIECKVIAPEAIHFTRSMHEPILNDDEACAQLDILGGHFYGWDGSSYPLAAKKGKEVWMTEYLINERQNNDKLDINWKDDGFLFARSVNDAMLANMSAWVHYSLKRFYGCLGDGTYGTKNNEITKRGYILSHYAKYVSGTTRVRHSLGDDTDKLSASAYLTESGDSVVVMVLNPSDNSYQTTLSLPFNSVSGLKIVTTETQNMVKDEIAMNEDFNAEVSVEPWSVSTFIFTKSSDLTDLEDDPNEGDILFIDNFDLSGASCVPDGWRTKTESETRYAGSYSLGPRVMSFSSEGRMPYAFYFRSGTSSYGDVSYGEDNNYLLPLEPGDYTLKFSTVGWKGTPKITAYIKRKGERGSGSFGNIDATPQQFVSENGSASRITETSDFVLPFTISETKNYILRWEVEKAAGGMNEALVGNIILFKNTANGVEEIVVDFSSFGTQPSYDIYGRKVKDVLHPGFYIKNGKKFIIR